MAGLAGVVVGRGVNMVPLKCLEVRLVKAVRVRGSGFRLGGVMEGRGCRDVVVNFFLIR